MCFSNWLTIHKVITKVQHRCVIKNWKSNCKIFTRNSSADEIANVNFLRRHHTRTTKYKKKDKNKQLSSH